MTTTIIFLLIILTLVIIHEAGHFFAAKISGVKVEEFAFGFPPKLFSVKKGETNYIFNSLPFGGYVKIFGENGEGETDKKDKRNFSNKNPFIKIFILAAGVIMNFVLAYILITTTVYFNKGIQVDSLSVKEYEVYKTKGEIKNEYLMIAEVSENSPASLTNLKVGDKINQIYINKTNNENIKMDFYKDSNNITKEISKEINNPDTLSITLISENNSSTTLIAKENDTENKKLIGLSFTKIANIDLSFIDILKFGFEKTIYIIDGTLIAFKDLFFNLFTKGELSQNVSGPVGMVKAVSDAKNMGALYTLLLAAVLSISLGVFNILPFPALDGGRILFVIIESITKKKISEKWQTILNGGGFLILILLMVIISVRDVLHLFN